MDRAEKSWESYSDRSIIRAATKYRNKYAPETQAIVEEQAKQRGLWEYILYLRGKKPQKPMTAEGILEGFACEGCRGTRLNPATGRCIKCNLPPEDFGYCKECDKFWSIPPGDPCPEHGNRLVRYKATMVLRRLGNFVLDYSISMAIIFISAILLPSLVAPLSLFGVFLYYVIFETIWQRTPGKFITGTKVVTVTGSKPTLDAIGIRTLARFVPFEPLSFLGEKVLGWHDRWTGTYVIKAPRLEGKTRPSEFPSSLISELPKEKTSGFAIASYGLSIYPLVNLLAPILGLVALIKIKKSRGFLLGRGLAIAGILIACITIPAGMLMYIQAWSRIQQERVIRTKADLKALHYAVLQFETDTGRVPTEEEGLKALLKKPFGDKKSSNTESSRNIDETIDTKKFNDDNKPRDIVSTPIAHEPTLTITDIPIIPMGSFRYLESKELPKDRWGRDFIYRVNLKSVPPFVIISLGADGKEGGKGYDADLLSTKLK